jgi:hypothetical protein
MSQLCLTILKPASGGFGEYDWAESTAVEGAEDFTDYESMCEDAQAEFAQTDELSGRIRDERGRVYRFEHAPHPDGSPAVSYEMVWIEAV